MSIFNYISHHFPSLVTPYLSYLDIFLTASNYHRTKSHVSVFLKRGGNMQLHVSVMFT